jgi:phthalate 4,5-cis-dihydrodiol dehydrogenase
MTPPIEPVHNALRLGVLGLGRAFTLMVPTFARDERIRLVAAFDPRESARAAFAATFGGRACDSAAAVCADPEVEWVYVATPHQFHAEHTQLAAAHGKHVLVEKPMAITLAECSAMIDACDRAGVHLLVGHSHSFDAPVAMASALIDAGRIGHVRMVHAMQYTDFLYRPRRPEELDTARGGGVIHSQAAHQIDIVRLLAGGMVHSVRAVVGRWDPARPTEGAYSALLTFQDGVFASVTYSGYGFYDTDVLMDGIGELGQPKSADAHAQTRARLRAVTEEAQEAALKAERNFGGRLYQGAPQPTPVSAQHFGPVIVSGERGDLRLSPRGVQVFDDAGADFVTVPAPEIPRQEVIDELWTVTRQGRPALHDGRWSRATVEVCLALLDSDRLGRDVTLCHQVPKPPNGHCSP